MGVSKRSQHSVLALLQSPTPSPKDSSSPPSWNPLTEANASLAQRRLTRQRKLRHVTDHELGRDNSSFAGVPQPLPLPADRSIRRDVDQVTTTTNRCHVRSTAISIRSSAGDIISSFHADEEDDEEAKRKASFPSRSAPASPRRASDAPKLLNLSGGNAARIAVAGGISQKAISFPVCYKNSFPAESPSSGAHPLPRPPGSGNPPARNQWQKGKLIGRGTFGSVYVGVNKETGASCAMKEVDLILDDPKSVECIKQLEQEIEMLRQLKHPNIVQYYGSEVVDGHFYIYLEYVYPGSINKYVREHFGAVTESVIRNFTRHILLGLAYLHSRKTVHRDIKGANLLVDTSGAVKLADFGMAKHLTGHSYDLSLKGSPYWMAPEVIKAAMQRNASPDLALAVDIWSLGCTIIEMINGKPPWSEFTAPQAMFKVLNSAPPIPESLSSEGKDFLNCCFRRNPVERPSAAKLLDHSFVRNLHQQNLSPSAHHVMEKLHIQRDRRKDAFDLAVAYSSARVRTSNRSPPSVVDTSSTWTLSL